MALQKEVLYAQAISWLLEATYEDVDLRSIAENIPTISHPREAIRILARSTYLPRLAIQYRNAMTTLQRTDNVNFRGRVDTKQETTTVLVLAGAVGHVLSSDPKWCYGVMRRIVNVIWPDASGEESEGRRELYLIHDALQGLCARFRIVNKSAEVRRAGAALCSNTQVQFSSSASEKVNSIAPITPPGALCRTTGVLLSTFLKLSGSIDLHDYGIADLEISFFFRYRYASRDYNTARRSRGLGSLLVGYISGGLVADHDRGLRWARPESPALAHALVTLEIERHLTMNVSELRHLISALGVIPVNVPGILGVLTPQHLLVHPSVSPALVTALSLSDEGDAPLADETWELLNYVASTIHVGSTVPLARELKQDEKRTSSDKKSSLTPIY
ncbi:hypothetical protein FRB98_009509 [Tulasnella sp. 332]|nr:hypothetical protein FRB98_009509 [Tulasnella sp. 332]